MEIDNKTVILISEESTLCRVCLSSDQNNQCIFQTDQDDQKICDTLDLSIKLRLCGGVEVSKEDGLPTSICSSCILRVNAAHRLRQQCQESDAKLRELYGKTKNNNTHVAIVIKDQYCQTENLLSNNLVKTDDTSVKEANEINLSNSILPSVNCNLEDKDIQYQHDYEKCIKIDKRTSEDAPTKGKCTEHEVSTVKRETYRTRRMTMFKRVTSMESLKNHKERQRQYIKRNGSTKCDITEDDSQKTLRSSRRTEKRISISDTESSYECVKCNRTYSSKKSLDRHTLTHNNKKFKCEKCDRNFLCLDKLLEHKTKLHKVKEKSKQISCKICHKNFRKPDTMVRHLNVHKRANPKEVFSILKEIRDKRKLENNIMYSEELDTVADNKEQCVKEEINKTNSSTNELRKHVPDVDHKVHNIYLSSCNFNSDYKSDSVDDAPLYQCKQCAKCYITERSLQRHILIHDEKKFICNVCNMKFFRQDRLKSHRDRYGHDEDKPCLEPQKPPDDKSAIKLINSWIREELDSDNEGKGFPCKICGKSYDTKKSLLKHQVNVHNTEESFCTKCGSVCTCGNKCKEQEKSNEKLKPYVCNECNKSFEKEMKLQRHLRIHKRAKEQQDSNFKRFLCHICSKTFRQNTGLMFHMRTHTGYKPHVCKYCGRGFTSNSNCINHERTHTGDRPFVCHFCSAAFAKSCTLKAHITTHTGEANYHCKTCGKSFRRLKYLKEHRFTHTGEKPYACKICGTAYSHSGSLFVHEKKCKAQYNSYQSVSVPSTQSYCQSQINSSTSTPVITPLSTPLPQSHVNNINGVLNTQGNKNYMDSIHRMNVPTAAAASVAATASSTGTSTGLHIHPNTDVSNVAPAVRSFTIIGQIFHS